MRFTIVKMSFSAPTPINISEIPEFSVLLKEICRNNAMVRQSLTKFYSIDMQKRSRIQETLQKSNILASQADKVLKKHKGNTQLYTKLKKELEKSMNEITALAGSTLRMERESQIDSVYQPQEEEKSLLSQQQDQEFRLE